MNIYHNSHSLNQNTIWFTRHAYLGFQKETRCKNKWQIRKVEKLSRLAFPYDIAGTFWRKVYIFQIGDQTIWDNRGNLSSPERNPLQKPRKQQEIKKIKEILHSIFTKTKIIGDSKETTPSHIHACGPRGRCLFLVVLVSTLYFHQMHHLRNCFENIKDSWKCR